MPVENESWKWTNEDLVERIISGLNKKAKKCIDVLSYSHPGNYTGDALISEKEMIGWDLK